MLPTKFTVSFGNSIDSPPFWGEKGEGEKLEEGISKVSRKLCNWNICKIGTLRKTAIINSNHSKFILRLVKNSRQQQTQEKKSQS